MSVGSATGGPRPRVVAVVGPTAAGKTELAVDLAAAVGAEIVSVDSRQVYRRLDVGTAKPSSALRVRVPHHLLDVVEPDEPYDAARFQREAREAVAGIVARGRSALLCGGSGFYLRALTEGLCPAPPADAALRTVLAREIEERGVAALHDELRAVDPASAERVSPNDAVRITRALEVARLSGRPLSEWQSAHRFSDRPYELLVFVLSPPVAVLDRRIAARSAEMWKAGVLDETRAVLEAGFAPSLPPLQAMGYREAQSVLAGTMSVEEAIRAMTLDTRRYAKRQRTWFRRLEDAVWIDGGEPAASLLHRVRRFLEEGRESPGE